jgi:hypothetical protein
MRAKRTIRQALTGNLRLEMKGVHRWQRIDKETPPAGHEVS